MKSRCVASGKPQTGPSLPSVELITADMTFLSHTGAALEFCPRDRETNEESNSMMQVEDNITGCCELVEYDIIQWFGDKRII